MPQLWYFCTINSIELHNYLIIPLGKLSPNKSINTSKLEALINMGKVVFILINVFPIHPSLTIGFLSSSTVS